MCLFTHFAAGALTGAATGNVGWAAVAGTASHAVLDAIPHYDHPDWRVELAGGVAALLLLLLMPFVSPAAVVGGICGMLPDLENLFQKLGWMDRKRRIYPSHNGWVPHGRSLGPRAILWQFAIFAACFLALGLFNPGTALAAAGTDVARMDRPRVTVVSGDRDQTVLRLDFPVLQMPTDWDRISVEQVDFALPSTIEESVPEQVEILPPRMFVSVAIPSRKAPQVEVLGARWWKEPLAEVATDDLVSFSLPSVYRSVPISGARIPLAARGGVLRSLTVRLDHQADSRWLAEESAAKSLTEPATRTWRETPPMGLANRSLFEQMRDTSRRASLARVAQKSSLPELFFLTDHWARLEIDETGVYSVSGQDLHLAGVTNTSVHPASLRLYRGGGLSLMADPSAPDSLQADRIGLNEVAIEVLGAEDGEWNLDDELHFYGVATSAWSDRLGASPDPLEHYDHPYAAQAVYWLTWDSTAVSPLPGSPRRLVTDAATPRGSEILSTARLRGHHEQQLHSDIGRVADDFVWYNAINASVTENFNLPGVVADSSAFFVVDWRGVTDENSSRYDTAEAAAWANGSLATRVATGFAITAQEDSLRVRLAGPFTPLADQPNSISLQRTGGDGDLCLDSFDILYWADLDLRVLPGQTEIPIWAETSTADQADLVVAPPAGQQVRLWNVTDPSTPRALTGAASGAYTGRTGFGIDLPPGQHTYFVAFTSERMLDVGPIQVSSPDPIRLDPKGVDYLVIYPGEFAPAARALADFRSTMLPDTDSPVAASYNVQEIYNNFSGGQKDWRAIRNFMRYVYQNGGQRLRYVCLIGNACRDYRNYLGRTPQVDLYYDFLPTEVRTPFPDNPTYDLRESPYATDDGLVSFDPPALLDVDYPDVAVGRLPAVNLAEAELMVANTIAYETETEPGAWRDRILMVADDTHKRGVIPYSGEHKHTVEAEMLCENLVPTSIDAVKIYAVAYDLPPGSTNKPEVRADINIGLNEGTTIYHYIGHGSQDSLADERIFEIEDIPALTNGMKRGLFVAFSCDVGVYDSTNRRSMGEVFLTSDAGGAIGSITASQVSYSTENDVLTNAFYRELFPDREVDLTQGIGQALQRAKAEMYYFNARRNSQRYNLMGDPALVLPHPRNDLQFASDSLDSLMTGRRHQVRLGEAGDLLMPEAGDSYDLRVEESSVTRYYEFVYYPNPDSLLSYVERGEAVFRGTGTADGDQLAVDFMVPKQMRFGPDARVRMVLTTPEGEHAAEVRVPAVRSPPTANEDVHGPSIELAFADHLQSVRSGALLEAQLSDPSGIAILGTSPITSILLEFDETGFMTDITPSFRYDPDSYTTGRIGMALPADMEPGEHVVSLYAADALGNVGSDTLSFRIQDEITTGIASVALFPNPTHGPCRLVFDLGEPMHLRWDIYTLAGHCIRTIEADFEEAGRSQIEWNGRDDQSDEIANGTYLYVLRGRSASDPEHPFHHTGKLVLMR